MISLHPYRYLLSLLLLTIPAIGQGQNKETQKQETQEQEARRQELLRQRSGLLQEWRRFNLEENALFGGQSKKDLKRVVEVQQQLIELDNRIINLGKVAQHQQEKDEKKENLERQKNLYGRLDSAALSQSRYQQQLEAAGKREASLKARIGRQQANNRWLSFALVLATGLLLFSLFYNPVKKKQKRNS